MHNPKVARYVLFGDLIEGYSLSDSLEELLRRDEGDIGIFAEKTTTTACS